MFGEREGISYVSYSEIDRLLDKHNEERRKILKKEGIEETKFAQMSFPKLALVCNLMSISFVVLNGTSKELMANHQVEIFELMFIANVTCLLFTLVMAYWYKVSLCSSVSE